MNEKLPPQSLQAEQSVLGGLMLDPQAIDRIGDLRPSDFMSSDNRMVMQAILDTAEDGGVVDIITVSERIERNTGDGMLTYLGGLAQATPSAHNIRSYAAIVRERARERKLLAALSECWDLTASGGLPLDDKLDRCQALLMGITEESATEPVHIGEAAIAHLEELKRRATGGREVVKSFFVDLDGMLGGGFDPGDLVIIAGRTSMGKTSLALNIAEHNARNREPALVFSIEMSGMQLMDRALSSSTRLPLQDIRNGKSSTHSHVLAALEQFKNWPLFIDDSSASVTTVNSIRAKARSIKRRYGLKLIVVDHLQMMRVDGRSRAEELGTITSGLKSLAKELHVPVLLLSQLNRAADVRGDKRPQLSDLRESGAIEQDADVVIFVHREEVHQPDNTEWKGLAELLIRKCRNGETGDVKMCWIGRTTRFESFAGQWPDRQYVGRARGMGRD